MMMIVNKPDESFRIYDHFKDDGTYRTCQPVLNEHYTRRALPDDETITRHLHEEKLTPKQIVVLLQ